MTAQITEQDIEALVRRCLIKNINRKGVLAIVRNTLSGSGNTRDVMLSAAKLHMETLQKYKADPDFAATVNVEPVASSSFDTAFDKQVSSESRALYLFLGIGAVLSVVLVGGQCLNGCSAYNYHMAIWPPALAFVIWRKTFR